MASARDRRRQTFTVPSTSGSYAFERLTFGVVGAGSVEESYQGVTIHVESGVASSVVELWLPRVGGGTKHPSAFVNDDYAYSGQSIAATGSLTYALAGYPGAQVRVKSGGSGGTATISATVF